LFKKMPKKSVHALAKGIGGNDVAGIVKQLKICFSSEFSEHISKIERSLQSVVDGDSLKRESKQLARIAS